MIFHVTNRNCTEGTFQTVFKSTDHLYTILSTAHFLTVSVNILNLYSETVQIYYQAIMPIQKINLFLKLNLRLNV